MPDDEDYAIDLIEAHEHLAVLVTRGALSVASLAGIALAMPVLFH